MYPEDPNDLSASHSSSSSDDEELETESLNTEVPELDRQLEANPYLYDSHVRRITLLRKAGELDRLREAREMMSQHFPLTPKLWLQWIKDEASLLTEGDDREHIYNLFKRALADYQSVDVWLEYCQYAIGGMGSGDTTELARTRAVLEDAVASQGLNFSQGAVLFEVYREFETICLVQLQAKGDPVEIKNQINRIDNIFQRQLGVPRVDIDQTMEEYKVFLTDIVGGKDVNVSTDCMTSFESARAKWRALENYETAVTGGGDENALLSAWQTYLTWTVEHASRKGTRGNVNKVESEVSFTPMEVICLFERAVTDLCLHVSVWQQMADYLETHVSADQQRLITTLSRAVRNIPWSSELWCRYALACEARAWDLTAGTDSVGGGSSEHQPSGLPNQFDSVKDIYETALKSGYATATDLTAVWTGYCDFLLRILRNYEDSSFQEHITALLRKTFERAQNHISAAFPDEANQDSPIYHYWAFIETKFLGDLKRSREIWETMLKIGHNSTKPAFWIAYLDFVKNHGETDHLLRVAGMAVNSVTGEYSEMVFQKARRCLAERGVQLRRLREFDFKIAQRRVHLASMEAKKKTKQQEGEKAPSLCQQLGDRQAPSSENTSKPGKRKADETLNSSSSMATKKRKKIVPEESVPNEVGESQANPDRPKHGDSVIHDPSKDDRTVFVSNLPFTTNEDELKSIFAKCGEVTSIRLVRDYAGKSKGFGYVEFSDPGASAAALELDRLPIGGNSGDAIAGRPMFVSVCDVNRRKSAFAYTTGMPEPKKLFVRNLDKVVNEDALRTFFSKHGRVQSVRVVTFRNGVPKGHAYVEFATEDEASRALVATDGVVFGSKAISVAISNPPQRPTEPTTRHSTGPTRTKKPPMNTQPRPGARTQLSFVPRALHRPSVGTAASASSEAKAVDSQFGVESENAGKTNEDFRKLFLNH